MIKEIMHRLMVEENAKRKKDGEEPLSRVPKPCDYFDLIGGTSTGGCVALILTITSLLTRYTKLGYYRIIALMLGRLRMSADTAIAHYDDLVQQVFSDMKRWGNEKFKATKFEEVIKSVVKAVTGDSESPLLEGDEAGVCRT